MTHLVATLPIIGDFVFLEEVRNFREALLTRQVTQEVAREFFLLYASYFLSGAALTLIPLREMYHVCQLAALNRPIPEPSVLLMISLLYLAVKSSISLHNAFLLFPAAHILHSGR